MSNLIRYIIQEDPEKQMKKNDLDYTKYSTSWAPIQKQSQEDKYKGYKFSSKNLLENSFNSLTANKSSQSKDDGSFMSGISNIFNNIKSDEKSSSNASLPQSIAKTATDESSKIGNVLSPKSIGNNTASYKIAQNNKPNIANNVNIPSIKKNTDNNFDRVFNKTLGEEGGYEDRPNKIDTATNMGFQQATLELFKKKHPELAQGFPEHVKDLTREQGRIIALKDFYEPYRIGEIKSPALQETMFDSFFNHSPKAPALWAQKAINQNTKRHVNEDGIFGSETINTINQLSEDEIIKVNNAILKQRLEDHEREKETNPNPYYKDYTVGLPDRFKRFEIK